MNRVHAPHPTIRELEAMLKTIGFVVLAFIGGVIVLFIIGIILSHTLAPPSGL
jgi:hypothetical protein